LEDKVNILGLDIANANYEDIMNTVSSKIASREKFSFHNVNSSIILAYTKNNEFKKSLDSFSCLFSDGIGMYAASRFLYGKKGLKERVNGTDLYYRILDFANVNNLKCFFFGGSSESVNLLPGIIRDKYPGIEISGILPREIDLKTEIPEKIKESNPDILFVGLGTPFQENWIKKYSDFVNVPVQIAVGSGLEFISGAKKRAPSVFLKSGFEWLYRIYLEPRRLWKRYVFGIPIFIFKIIIFKFKLLTIKEKKQI